MSVINPFSVVPLSIQMSELLSPTEKTVWIALARFAGGPKKPTVYPAIDTLVTIAGKSRRTVQRALRTLAKVGAIEDQGTGPRGVRAYRLDFRFGEREPAFLTLMRKHHGGGDTAMTPPEAEGVSSSAEGVSSRVPKGCHSCVTRRDHEPTKEPTTPPREPGVQATRSSSGSVVVRAGGRSLVISQESMRALEAAVVKASPCFDGVAGRPSAPDIVDQALAARWLGRKFRLDERGVRAHCVAYAQVEAQRHWSGWRPSAPPKTPARFQLDDWPEGDEALPEGVRPRDLFAAVRRGANPAELLEVAS